MPIDTVRIPLRYGFGVNCYLIRAEGGFVLIDTGMAPRRAVLLAALEAAGCTPGRLRLIVLTHGHLDHAGNAAHLRAVYGAPIAMHRRDVRMVEERKLDGARGTLAAMLVRAVLRVTGMGRTEPFTPDLLLDEGDELAVHGLEARVLHLPGHTPGSIGLLTADGELYAGDVVENLHRPAPASLVESHDALAASVQRVRSLGAAMIYPGHGAPFAADRLRVSSGAGGGRRRRRASQPERTGSGSGTLAA